MFMTFIINTLNHSEFNINKLQTDDYHTTIPNNPATGIKH